MWTDNANSPDFERVRVQHQQPPRNVVLRLFINMSDVLMNAFKAPRAYSSLTGKRQTLIEAWLCCSCCYPKFRNRDPDECSVSVIHMGEKSFKFEFRQAPRVGVEGE